MPSFLGGFISFMYHHLWSSPPHHGTFFFPGDVFTISQVLEVSRDWGDFKSSVCSPHYSWEVYFLTTQTDVLQLYMLSSPVGSSG